MVVGSLDGCGGRESGGFCLDESFVSMVCAGGLKRGEEMGPGNVVIDGTGTWLDGWFFLVLCGRLWTASQWQSSVDLSKL